MNEHDKEDKTMTSPTPSNNQSQSFKEFAASQLPGTRYLQLKDDLTDSAMADARIFPVNIYTVKQGCRHVESNDCRSGHRKCISAFAMLPPADILVTGCRAFKSDGTAWARDAATWKFVKYLKRKKVLKAGAKVVLIADESQRNDRCSGIGWESFRADTVITGHDTASSPAIVCPAIQPAPAVPAIVPPLSLMEILSKPGKLGPEKEICLVGSPVTYHLMPELLNLGCKIFLMIPGRRGIATPDGKWIGEKQIAPSAFARSVSVFIASSPEYPSNGAVKSKDRALIDTRLQIKSAGLLAPVTEFIALITGKPDKEFKEPLPHRVTELFFRPDIIIQVEEPREDI